MFSWPIFRLRRLFHGLGNKRPCQSMQAGQRTRRSRRPGCCLELTVLEDRVVPSSVSILATFNGTNGLKPYGAMVEDGSGDLFGTTYDGGAAGDGTIFELKANSNIVMTLASFNGTNGENPYGGLIIDGNGNLFGTTDPNDVAGSGTVFELAYLGNGTYSNTITPLASFGNVYWGLPFGGLLEDRSGNLLFTTKLGGAGNDGAVCELAYLGNGTYSNTITTLASFGNANGDEAAIPDARLIEDANGNLFGTTFQGGPSTFDGIVFELPYLGNGTYSNTIIRLASFDGTNGRNPVGGLIEDGNGNLFGTTQLGGTNNDGTVFEVQYLGSGSYSDSVTTLASFDGTDGENPGGGLVEDSHGNLLGTTAGGGASGVGTVFEVPAGSSGTITTVSSFDATIGDSPAPGALVEDASGNLFGTTASDGPTGVGTVFEVSGSVVASAGTPQTAQLDSSFAKPLVVTVEDAAGNPVVGATVTFSAPTSGASAALSSTTAVTNAAGQASITATANDTEGSYTVQASIGGESTPAAFSLTNFKASPGVNNFTFPNVDGGTVTVHVSRPLLTGAAAASMFTLVDDGQGKQLQEINLNVLGSAANGLSLSVTATPSPTGGGAFVNVGDIQATGIDLDSVTVQGDLGAIAVGNSPGTGLAALTVHSLGEYGTATQAPGGGLATQIDGNLGSLTVATDVVDADFQVDGSIGSVKIGGSLIGGTADNSGLIKATGNIGAVTVDGSIEGGSGTASGQLYSVGSLGNVTIGHDLLGSAGTGSGEIVGNDGLRTVTIGGNIAGAAGWNSGEVASNATLTSVTVGGSLLGGSGDFSGQIATGKNLGPIKIAANVQGGGGQDSGQIFSAAGITSVALGGSLLGGAGPSSGLLYSADNLGPVTIQGDVLGAAAVGTGFILANNGAIAGVTIGGSLVGGSGDDTGGIDSSQSLGPVSIHGDVVGGNVAGTATLTTTGSIVANTNIASVRIGGSIIAGTNTSSATSALTQSGCINAGTSLGPVLIGGSLVGNNTNPVFITAVGQAALAARARTDVALASLTVRGDVTDADILAGYNANLDGVNGQASIGAVRVDEDWIASNLIAGASADGGAATVTAGTNFGGNGSALLPTKPFPGDSLTAAIASIVIGGTVLGTPASDNAGDAFGFVAEAIKALSVGGSAVKLKPGPSDLLIGQTDDVTLLEVS